MSKNRKLEKLYAHDNALTSINLSANKALSILVISGNKIKSIDIGSCPGVQEAMKLKKKTTKKTVAWYTEEEWGIDNHLMIDRSTTLTAGDKVLYKGK